ISVTATPSWSKSTIGVRTLADASISVWERTLFRTVGGAFLRLGDPHRPFLKMLIGPRFRGSSMNREHVLPEPTRFREEGTGFVVGGRNLGLVVVHSSSDPD